LIFFVGYIDVVTSGEKKIKNNKLRNRKKRKKKERFSGVISFLKQEVENNE
jgi:hypothetical protein